MDMRIYRASRDEIIQTVVRSLQSQVRSQKEGGGCCSELDSVSLSSHVAPDHNRAVARCSFAPLGDAIKFKRS